MQISNNKVVSLQYELRIASGEIVDAADAKQPFAFIHGLGHTLPSFDARLEGLKEGEEFAFTLAADEAYGQSNEADIVSIPKEIFSTLTVDIFLLGIANLTCCSNPLKP